MKEGKEERKKDQGRKKGRQATGKHTNYAYLCFIAQVT